MLSGFGRQVTAAQAIEEHRRLLVQAYTASFFWRKDRIELSAAELEALSDLPTIGAAIRTVRESRTPVVQPTTRFEGAAPPSFPEGHGDPKKAWQFHLREAMGDFASTLVRIWKARGHWLVRGMESLKREVLRGDWSAVNHYWHRLVRFLRGKSATDG